MDVRPKHTFITMGRSIFEAFSEEFYRELRGAKSNPAAFAAASKTFENKYNLEAFPSYDSFRKRNERRRKK